jgi:hypothetical protein
MAIFLESESGDFEPSEYHLWFLIDASAELRVVAVEMVECVEAALDVVLEDEVEDLLNILVVFDALYVCFGGFGGLVENLEGWLIAEVQA